MNKQSFPELAELLQKGFRLTIQFNPRARTFQVVLHRRGELGLVGSDQKDWMAALESFQAKYPTWLAAKKQSKGGERDEQSAE